jgi:hypothetical protein
MGWGEAIKGFLVALPDLVKLVRPIAEFLTEFLGPDPAKKASELGEYLRLHAEANQESDIELKKQKKYEALKKLAEFARSN